MKKTILKKKELREADGTIIDKSVKKSSSNKHFERIDRQKHCYDNDVQFQKYSEDQLYSIFTSKIYENIIMYCNNRYMRTNEISKEFNIPLEFVSKIVNGPHSVISYPLSNGKK